MLLDILLIIAGLALLFGGGELLVRGSVRLATHFGLSPLLAGLVIVGFGTSAPELVASIEAVRVGAPAIAWGNVVGSNVANTLLILGAAALVRPIPVSSGPLWRDGGVGLAAALLLLAFGFGGVSRLAGGIFVAGMAAYLLFAYRAERTKARSTGAGEKEAAAELADPALKPSAGGNTLISAGLTLAGLALIVAGGNVLVGAARDMALMLGLSETVVGLTIVAVGTSAPEFATSIVAARKGEGDIAFGNVLGSNIYNILAIGGTTALLAPGSFPAELIAVELPVLIMAALLIMIFARTGHRFTRAEGAIMLTAYALYLTFAVLRAG